MRTHIMIGAALLAVGLFGQQAAAERITLGGNYSSAQIKSACDKAGGTYIEDSNTNSFGCTSDCKHTGNNDNDSNHCAVNCQNNTTPGNCTGYTPGRMVTPAITPPDLKSFMSDITKKKAN